MNREEHDRIVATGMHECASDCPLPPMTDRPATEPRTVEPSRPMNSFSSNGGADDVCGHYVPCGLDWGHDGTHDWEAAQGAAPRAEGLDARACSICGDEEPHHVHDGEDRIEDYFTVGRGQTDFQAAQSWKRKYLAARLSRPSDERDTEESR